MGNQSIDLSQFTQEELKKILAVAALFENKTYKTVEEENISGKKTKPKPRSKPKPKPKAQSNNWFETSDIFNMHKADSIVDKKLWQDKTPEPRNLHGNSTITIECRVCHKEYTISEKLLPPDKDRFTCDKCLGSSRPETNG